jgi:glyoxylase-like metal-dependent hydrolase (beta-lactamase superfamily II)
VLIDCDSCTVRGLACGDCVVTVLLGVPPVGVELDDAEQAAISALADQGLVPPLRLVTRHDHRNDQHDGSRSAAS